MIDVIIPAFNAHKTIKKTLSSIAMQTIKEKINVTIVDDVSDMDYSSIVSLFNDVMNIQVINLSKNSGAGVARQYGIDNTSGKYITFIDADDVFYDIYAVENMYNAILNNDMVIGKIMDIQTDKKYIWSGHIGCVHGKMYKRDFLEKENIRFSTFRTHEDNSFNRLCIAANPKFEYVDDIVYVYNENENSVTKKDEMYTFYSCEEFCNSMYWLLKESEKRKYSKEMIGINLLESIMYIFKIYNIYYDIEDKELLKEWVKKLIDSYRNYTDSMDYKTKMEVYFGYICDVIIYESIFEFMNIIEL